MSELNSESGFSAKLLRPAKTDDQAPWAFIVLPQEVSDKLPRRGRTTIDGKINGHRFTATLDPDGKRSHWLRIGNALQEESGVAVGDVVTFEIEPVDKEPEPPVPDDFEKALAAAPEARRVWDDTTTIARLDWIHWITSAKQSKTREKRINDACEMLADGKRRVCCFDPSGFYSKALRAPVAED